MAIKKLDQQGRIYFKNSYEHGQDHVTTPPTFSTRLNLASAIVEELNRKHPSSLDQIYEDLENLLITQHPNMTPEEIHAEIVQRSGGIF